MLHLPDQLLVQLLLQLLLLLSWAPGGFTKAKTFLLETGEQPHPGVPVNVSKARSGNGGSDYGFAWGEGSEVYDMDFEPAEDEDYGEVFEPKNQIKDVINYWGAKGKGIACSNSGSPPKIPQPNVCYRYEDCGCRMVNLYGSIYSGKKKKWRGTMSSTWSAKYKVNNCFDWHPATCCSTKAGQVAPWIILDIGEVRTIGAVNLFAQNKNAYKMANVQVRVTKRQPKLSKNKMFKGGSLIGTFKGPATDNAEIAISTTSPKKGRYVIVQMENQKNYLALLDIKVTDVGCQKRSSKGADYLGEAEVTRGGRLCKMWGELSQGALGAKADTEAGHNSCRNPSSSDGGVWCYTVDPKVRWEFCAVPYC